MLTCYASLSRDNKVLLKENRRQVVGWQAEFRDSLVRKLTILPVISLFLPIKTSPINDLVDAKSG